jgi:hypothetical protein
MPENIENKEKKIKIVIYQGHIHKISIFDDTNDRKQNELEKKAKTSD